jgi:hypothetical protein
MTATVTNYTALNFWFHVLSWVLAGASLLYARHASRNKKTDERLTKIEQALSGINCPAHEARTEMVEKSVIELRAELAHLPTQKQFGQLNASISDLNGSLQKTAGRLEGINRAVDLINEFLINQGSKRS